MTSTEMESHFQSFLAARFNATLDEVIEERLREVFFAGAHIGLETAKPLRLKSEVREYFSKFGTAEGPAQ